MTISYDEELCLCFYISVLGRTVLTWHILQNICMISVFSNFNYEHSELNIYKERMCKLCIAVRIATFESFFGFNSVVIFYCLASEYNIR
jgi:hypothetical protein